MKFLSQQKLRSDDWSFFVSSFFYKQLFVCQSLARATDLIGLKAMDASPGNTRHHGALHIWLRCVVDHRRWQRNASASC